MIYRPHAAGLSKVEFLGDISPQRNWTKRFDVSTLRENSILLSKHQQHGWKKIPPATQPPCTPVAGRHVRETVELAATAH